MPDALPLGYEDVVFGSRKMIKERTPEQISALRSSVTQVSLAKQDRKEETKS